MKTDKIVIQQMTGLAASCLCCYEGENLFEISDRLGHVILRATEDSNCCYRQCCERLRPFVMTIKDRQSNLVIKINRPKRCDNCFCCPCLNQVLHTHATFSTIFYRTPIYATYSKMIYNFFYNKKRFWKWNALQVRSWVTSNKILIVTVQPTTFAVPMETPNTSLKVHLPAKLGVAVGQENFAT